jgi:hypothetical protein
MTELGSDFDRSGPGGDLTAAMRLLSTPAEQVLAWLQNQAERLQTPRGAVWYDRNYGWTCAHTLPTTKIRPLRHTRSIKNC